MCNGLCRSFGVCLDVNALSWLEGGQLDSACSLRNLQGKTPLQMPPRMVLTTILAQVRQNCSTHQNATVDELCTETCTEAAPECTSRMCVCPGAAWTMQLIVWDTHPTQPPMVTCHSSAHADAATAVQGQRLCKAETIPTLLKSAAHDGTSMLCTCAFKIAPA